jgi:phosphatidylglycerophosphate synthase
MTNDSTLIAEAEIAETEQMSESPVSRSHVAVILANDSHGASSFDPLLASVGALPVLLRAILGAKKAGARRIVVVVNSATGPLLRRRLLDTKRLPASTEWVEPDRRRSLAGLLQLFPTSAHEHLVLVAADRIYHPSLHRRAAEWTGEGDAFALKTGGQLTGIYALSRNAVVRLAEQCPSVNHSLEQLNACLRSTGSVEYDAAPEDKSQRISTPQDRLAAERKLDSWLVKPTDGIFARTNRRVSIPISRQLIKFPITPNMVSLFTLGVSFMSGWYFARGGYWYMLLGAVLGLFASILDGSDGEVARLTFQDSAFGCWLETICDYLYYVFTFVGMTIGLTGTSGSRSFLAWGGLLLFGAILSFVVTSFQRHRLTAGRPEELLTIWQTKAASRKSPGILSLAGRIEFVIRRCFMPYALLFFAIFNILQVAFITAAIGANVVWLVALYSHYRFTSAPTSAPPTSRNPEHTITA